MFYQQWLPQSSGSYREQSYREQFEDSSRLKSWSDFKAKHNLTENIKFFWVQIIRAIPRSCNEVS